MCIEDSLYKRGCSNNIGKTVSMLLTNLDTFEEIVAFFLLLLRLLVWMMSQHFLPIYA